MLHRHYKENASRDHLIEFLENCSKFFAVALTLSENPMMLKDYSNCTNCLSQKCRSFLKD